MKKVIFIFLLLPVFASAQTGTTMEEWRYATKGYWDDVKMGKDASKTGYTFEHGHTFTDMDGTEFEFIEMKKNGLPRVTLMIEKAGRYEGHFVLPVGKVSKEIATLSGKQWKPSEISYPRLQGIIAAINDYRTTAIIRE